MNTFAELKHQLMNNKLNKMTDVQRTIYVMRNYGITREELAYKLGVSYSTVVRWERGLSEPKVSEFTTLKNLRDKYASDSKSRRPAEST